MLMTQKQALETLAKHRGERIVVTTMSAVGIWPSISDSPLDFAYLPSAMGQAPPLGMGLALAHPERGVIVVNGDGCMMMNLGCLATLAEQKANVFLIVIENGIYEVTGGQPIAGAGGVDFPAMARAAGFARIDSFDTLAEWQSGAAEALSGIGPAFIKIKTEARQGQKTPKAPRPMSEQIARLQGALGVG